MRTCNPTELQPICASDVTIDDCGKPIPQYKAEFPLPHVLRYEVTLPANTTLTGEKKRVPKDHDFVLHSINGRLDPDNPTIDFYYRIKYPDGRWSSQVRESASVSLSTGQRRRGLRALERYPAAGFISMEFENRTATEIKVVLLLEGTRRIKLG